MKQRKQMRVYDLYRAAIIGKTSKIRGIHQYWCNDDVTRVVITFDGDPDNGYSVAKMSKTIRISFDV